MSFDINILEEFSSFINKSAAAIMPTPPAPDPSAPSPIAHPQVLSGAAIPRETEAPQPTNNATATQGAAAAPKPATPPNKPLDMSGSFMKKSK